MTATGRVKIFDSLDRREELENFHRGSCIVASRVCPGEPGNQDSALALQLNSHTAVLAIADGAGGYSDGAYASQLLIDTLEKKISSWHDTGDLRMPIIEAIETCNITFSQRPSRCASTVIVAELQGHTVRHYLVGDSSIYVVGQRGAVRLQSVPQSVVGYGIESGLLPEAAAQQHEERHIVLNLVGIEGMKIELGTPVKLNKRDTILICSDGLTDNLAQEDIIDTLRSGDLALRTDELIQQATEAMSTIDGHADDLTTAAWRAGSQVSRGSRRSPRA